jgi:2-polyprenyl-6-methoxyphenol hydroxylase-like FAD-dependent oxidoreductase
VEGTGRRSDGAAVVIGAGIGGLCTVIALRRAGIDARVFERRPSLEEAQFGTGLSVWSNAVKALRKLGLSDEIETAGPHMERFDQRSWKGELLASWPIGDMGRRFGAPTVNLTRERLHGMLNDALEQGVVTYGATCTGFTQDAGGVTANFESGPDAQGDVLIGADGIKSIVRATMFGSSPPRFAGYTAWRGLVPFQHERVPPQVFQQIWGRGSRFAFYHVDDDRLYWIAVRNAPMREPEAPAGGKADLLARFRGWMEPVEAIIAATDEAAIQRMDIEDRDPHDRWGDGRVTLVGDAIHPMTFNVGQGACQAIEDSVVLARALESDGDAVAALRAYEVERKERTAGMMRLARRIGRTAQWEHPLACALRDQIWKRFLGRVGVKGQAKFMGHDV